MNEKDAGKLEFWAILELFGHQKIAGFVREVALGGDSMLRVDVPEVIFTKPVYGQPGDAQETVTIPAFTKFYSPKSVYAMQPVSEETAKAVIQGLRAEPIKAYDLGLVTTRAALPEPDGYDEGEINDEFDDDDDDE